MLPFNQQEVKLFAGGSTALKLLATRMFSHWCLALRESFSRCERGPAGFPALGGLVDVV